MLNPFSSLFCESHFVPDQKKFTYTDLQDYLKNVLFSTVLSKTVSVRFSLNKSVV